MMYFCASVRWYLQFLLTAPELLQDPQLLLVSLGLILKHLYPPHIASLLLFDLLR